MVYFPQSSVYSNFRCSGSNKLVTGGKQVVVPVTGTGDKQNDARNRTMFLSDSVGWTYLSNMLVTLFLFTLGFSSRRRVSRIRFALKTLSNLVSFLPTAGAGEFHVERVVLTFMLLGNWKSLNPHNVLVQYLLTENGDRKTIHEREEN